ncbi:AhpC/TSA family protein [Chitinophagaceae bacterium LB-8]|uniref:AhpC/TSA family protein n=1 Tax=Paraflavisolibacter caeni TaxID=2982496 RepID=A0A9X2XX37_9BACT|nr:AhpC/TSA family protein [Paraflavisolibacter caeni]MCU7551089.1 AhpC/TSA family protein [Paraflavisolibacter caeni]
MRTLIYSSLLLLIACNNNKQSSFEVEGSIKNSGAKTVYLEEASIGSFRPVIVDSAKLDKDGKFLMDALAKEETIYNLRLDENVYPVVSFINDSKHITINADLKGQEVYTVKGSHASEQLKEFLHTSGEKLRSIYNSNRTIDSLQKAAVGDSIIGLHVTEHTNTVNELKKYTADFISKSKSAALSVFVLGTFQSMASNPAFAMDGFSNEELQQLIGQTAAKFPEHQGVASINKSMLAEMQKAKAVAASSLLNKPAPDFTLPDVNGNPVSLSSYKGKYVLVDFWASWCRPCRMENPNVVQAYNKFKDKNFTVLGVSLDRPDGKDDWVKAIQDDKLAWTHVSDLKFWESSVVPLYHFEGIPYNVLVDPTGKIIAESLRGEDLERKLSEVLK